MEAASRANGQLGQPSGLVPTKSNLSLESQSPTVPPPPCSLQSHDTPTAVALSPGQPPNYAMDSPPTAVDLDTSCQAHEAHLAPPTQASNHAAGVPSADGSPLATKTVPNPKVRSAEDILARARANAIASLRARPVTCASTLLPDDPSAIVRLKPKAAMAPALLPRSLAGRKSKSSAAPGESSNIGPGSCPHNSSIPVERISQADSPSTMLQGGDTELSLSEGATPGTSSGGNAGDGAGARAERPGIAVTPTEPGASVWLRVGRGAAARVSPSHAASPRLTERQTQHSPVPPHSGDGLSGSQGSSATEKRALPNADGPAAKRPVDDFRRTGSPAAADSGHEAGPGRDAAGGCDTVAHGRPPEPQSAPYHQAVSLLACVEALSRVSNLLRLSHSLAKGRFGPISR